MRFLTICTVALTAIGIYPLSSQAFSTSDGTVWFAKPPRLVSASTTFDTAEAWGATYYFTINLPDNAGEPLQKVTITQREGVDDIQYHLKDTYAFEGTGWNQGNKLPLKYVTSDQESHAISVTFDPPVPPGKTVTIALQPIRNPFDPGVYLFGIKTFPAGEKSAGLYLGVGRLHFYRWH
jgi:hypothetical protein